MKYMQQYMITKKLFGIKAPLKLNAEYFKLPNFTLNR